MFVLIYLGGSCLCLSLGTIVLAVTKLQGEADMGHASEVYKVAEIPGSVHWRAN